VDVEDWYHPLIKDPAEWHRYEDRIVPSTVRLLELLEAGGNRATCFVLGAVAERHPELVRRILAGGHEVGSHGYHHQALHGLDPVSFRDDLRRSLEALRNGGAGDVVSYRAPYFSLGRDTAWALGILAEHGLRFDSSVFPLRTGYYGDSRGANRPYAWGPLLEFPVVLPRIGGLRVPLSGGFYSRLFPTALVRAGVARVRATGIEPMFYIHPWEMDPGQPRIRVGAFLTWRHYLRLDRTESMLSEILRRWQWRSLREAAAASEMLSR